MGDNKSNPDDVDVMDTARALLHQLGLTAICDVKSIIGGRNNRTFRVWSADGHWLMKRYFCGDTSNRDRRAVEWGWTHFCWQNEVTAVPRPLATDANQSSSLFEFVDGRHLSREEIKPAHVEQAIEFVRQVNCHRRDPTAASLSLAAEACFSWQEHLACINRRVERLVALPVCDQLDAELHQWVETTLQPFWNEMTASLKSRFAAEELIHNVSDADRILSPSDFGFHNALWTASGTLKFVDFEYAGWDDPAKLICDFYWQQERPVPPQTLPLWIESLSRICPTVDLEKRVRLLFPLYGVKWCCILLNEFLPADRQRREFAQVAAVTLDRRAEQLACAQKLLADAFLNQ